MKTLRNNLALCRLLNILVHDLVGINIGCIGTHSYMWLSVLRQAVAFSTNSVHRLSHGDHYSDSFSLLCNTQEKHDQRKPRTAMQLDVCLLRM